MYYVYGYSVSGLPVSLRVGSDCEQPVNLFLRKSLQPQAFPWGKAADSQVSLHDCLMRVRGEGVGDAAPYARMLFILASEGYVHRIPGHGLTVPACGSRLDQEDAVAPLVCGYAFIVAGGEGMGEILSLRDAPAAAAAHKAQPGLPAALPGTGGLGAGGSGGSIGFCPLRSASDPHKSFSACFWER